MALVHPCRAAPAEVSLGLRAHLYVPPALPGLRANLVPSWSASHYDEHAQPPPARAARRDRRAAPLRLDRAARVRLRAAVSQVGLYNITLSAAGRAGLRAGSVPSRPASHSGEHAQPPPARAARRGRRSTRLRTHQAARGKLRAGVSQFGLHRTPQLAGGTTCRRDNRPTVVRRGGPPPVMAGGPAMVDSFIGPRLYELCCDTTEKWVSGPVPCLVR